MFFYYKINFWKSKTFFTAQFCPNFKIYWNKKQIGLTKLNLENIIIKMEIKEVKLNNFRNYSQAKIDFKNGLNFIVGKNAQGKTNLLESIYISSIGKSPRIRKDKLIIKFGEERAKIDIDFFTLAGKKNIQIFLDKQNKKAIKIYYW